MRTILRPTPASAPLRSTLGLQFAGFHSQWSLAELIENRNACVLGLPCAVWDEARRNWTYYVDTKDPS